MTPVEKARFRESVSSNNKKSKFFQLYKLIEDGKLKKETDVLKYFDTESSFYDAKKYLIARLKESITLELTQNDPELGKLYNVLFAHALYKKEMYKLAEKILQDTMCDDLNSVEAGIQVIVAILLMRLGFVKQDYKLMENSDNKLFQLLEYISLVEKYRSFKLELNNGAKLNAISEFELSQFVRDESFFKTPRDQNGYNYFMAKLFERKYHDFDRAYVYHSKSYAIYKSHIEHSGDNLNLQNFETGLFILHHYIFACLNKGNFETAACALNEQLSFEKNSRYKNIFSKKLNMASMLLFSMVTQQKVVEHLAYAQLHFKTLKIESKNRIDLNAYLFYTANLFLAGKYKEVIQLANQAFGITAGQSLTTYFVLYNSYLYFLFLISHLHFGNIEIVNKYFKNMQKELNIEQTHHKRWELFIDGLINYHVNFRELSKIQQKKLEYELKNLARNISAAPEHFIYSFLNLNTWIDTYFAQLSSHK